MNSDSVLKKLHSGKKTCRMTKGTISLYNVVTRHIVNFFKNMLNVFSNSGFLSPRHGASPGFRMGSRPPDIGISCEYSE